MAEIVVPEPDNRVTFCGECGFTSEYDAVLQHFKEQHGVKDDDETGTNEVTIVEAPIVPISLTEEPSDASADLNDNERNIMQWTKTYEAKLITLVKEKQQEYNSPYIRKKQFWKLISDELKSKHNICATPSQCDNKWKSVTRRSRKREEQIRGIKFKFIDDLTKTRRLKNTLNESDQISDDSVSPQMMEDQTSSIENGVEVIPSFPDEISKDIVNLKRHRNEDFSDEPRWFKQFRVECQKRHEERIKLQNKLLEQHQNLMMQLILTMANMKK